MQNVGDKLIGIGTQTTLATAPIAAFLGTALKAASDQQTAFAQLDAVLKSTAGVAGVTAQAAKDLAQSLSGVTRFSDDAVLGAENMLLTFTSIGKDIFPQVTQVTLDMSQALGQDLKSSAIQLGKALNDPLTGLTALRRVGVQFTQDQEDMIKGMVKAGDLAGAQAAILKELTREFGGSAVAAGQTFAGAMDILNHKFEEFQQKIGYILMPILEEVTGRLSTLLDKVVAWTQANPQLTATIVKIAAALVVLGPALIGIGTAIKVIGIAVGALTSPIGLVIAAVSLLALAFSTNFLGIRDLVESVFSTIQDAFGKLAPLFADVSAAFQKSGLLAAINQFFADLEDGSTIITNFLTALGVAPDTAQKVSDAVGKVVGVFDGFFQSLKPGLADVGAIFGTFLQNFQAGLNLLTFYAGYSASKILSALGLTGLWDAIHPTLQHILDWFTGTGNDSLSGVLSAVPGWIDQNILAPIRGIWVIARPLLQPVIDWFNNDFLTAINQVAGWINTNIVVPVTTFWNTIQPLVNQVVGIIVAGLQLIFKPIIDIINSALDAWEQIRRAGGGAPMRALPGESSPGVTAPNAPGYYDSKGVFSVVPPTAYPGYGPMPTVTPFMPTPTYTPGGPVGAFPGALTPFPVFQPQVPIGPHDYRGSYSANTPYMVGTGAQPELFLPTSSGMAIPNADQLGGSGGFTWTGDLVVQGGGSVNVSKQQIDQWMGEWWDEIAR